MNYLLPLQMHRITMLIVAILTFVGVGLAYAYVGGYDSVRILESGLLNSFLCSVNILILQSSQNSGYT